MSNVIRQAELIALLAQEGVTITPQEHKEHDRTFTQACDEARRVKTRTTRRGTFRAWRFIGGPGIGVLMCVFGLLRWEWIMPLLVIMFFIDLVEDWRGGK